MPPPSHTNPTPISPAWGLDKDGSLQSRETGLSDSNGGKATGESTEIQRCTPPFVITVLTGHRGQGMNSKINQEVIPLMKGGINQLKSAILLSIDFYPAVYATQCK